MTLLMMRVSSLVFKETSGKSVVVVLNVVLDFLEELEATEFKISVRDKF